MEVCPLAPANLRPRLQSPVFNSPPQFLSLPGFLYSNPALFTKPRVGGPNLDHQSPSHPTPSSETHGPDSQGSASPLPLLPATVPPSSLGPRPQPCFSAPTPAAPLSAGLPSAGSGLLLEALLLTVTHRLLPGPASTGPPGPAFSAAPVVLLHPTSRVDREPYVDAAPVPRVQAVEQVDAEEAPGPRRAPCGAHRNLGVDCSGL